jgi:hypothetical protein
MKAVFAALALASFGTAAFAIEATQFDDAPAAASPRAAAKPTPLAQLLGRNIGEATVFTDTPPSATTRADVRATARALGRTGPGLSYGEATVFADPVAR